MPQRIPGVTAPSGAITSERPPLPPRATQRPVGMRRYGANVSPISLGGPFPVPDGFLNGNNSPEEYAVWWALREILGPPDQGNWTYQTRITPQQAGGIKPDFLIFAPLMVMRVQSPRYHQLVNSWKAAYDREQRIQLERKGYQVIDLFPQYYMREVNYDTGVAVLREVRAGLRGVQRPDPITTATSWARA